ncbi:N-acetyltransferase family protein [Rhodovibrionaceae bacterium A322]
MTDISFHPMTADHGAAVLAIFQEGLDTGITSFRELAGSWEEFNARQLAACRWVALDRQGKVLGWAALSGISSREVYRGIAEVSIYLTSGARGQGLGGRLLQHLIDDSEKQGFWTLQAGIFPENEASVGVHLAHGFRVIGTREKMGQTSYGPRKGDWRDVLLLERRSSVVGQD